MKVIIETEEYRAEIEDKKGVTVESFLDAYMAAMVGVGFCNETIEQDILDKADEIRTTRQLVNLE